MSDKQYPIGGYAPGSYHCTCCKCGVKFNGDKRAVECEPCAVAAKEKFDALTPEEQEEVRKRNIETWNEFVKNNSSIEQLSGADQVCGKTELNNLATISQPQVAVWVKVSERLPDHYKVRFKDKHGNEFNGNYSKESGQYYAYGFPCAVHDVVEWRVEQVTTSNKDEAVEFAKYLDQQRNSVTPEMWNEKVVWNRPDAFQEWLRYYEYGKNDRP